jgi:hypothetical protein
MIVHFGGGTTDDYKRVEFPNQSYNPGYSWLLKSYLGYTPYRQLQTTVNFQTHEPGKAGVVLGWKDENNYTAVLLDQWQDTAWLLTVKDGQANWQNNGNGSTAIAPGEDYVLIAFSPDWSGRGMGNVSVWLDPPYGDLQYLFSSVDQLDIRGQMGVGVMDGMPRVLFDGYWSIGEEMADPGFTWVAPAGDNATADVNGESVWLAGTAANDLSVWKVEYWRYNADYTSWEYITNFWGPAPFEVLLNTGQLFFGSNPIVPAVYAVNGVLYLPPTMYLNRLRIPQSVGASPASLTLTADGQSQTQLAIEARDSGGNLLANVEVTVSGEKVTVVPSTLHTDAEGQAVVTVTAGTAAGTGTVTFQSGNVKGEANRCVKERN